MSQQATSWVQVISQLRNGVKLKPSGVGESARKPIEYKLTPYEMLMDDIRSGRNKLRQVMVDGTPPRVKKDAPAVILEFIRCRPLLRKVFIPFSFVCLFLPRAPRHAFVIVIDLLSIFFFKYNLIHFTESCCRLNLQSAQCNPIGNRRRAATATSAGTASI